MGDTQVQQVPFARNALAVQNVDLRLAERGGNFVLHHLDLGPVADHFLTVFDGCHAPNFAPYRRVELQRASAGSCLRITKHDPDLFPHLINEDEQRVGPGYDAR